MLWSTKIGHRQGVSSASGVPDWLDMSKLSQFRVDAESPPEPRLTPVVFKGEELLLLAFDQSLANTGWALMEIEGTKAVIRQTGMIKTVKEAKGHEDNLTRATEIFVAAKSLMGDLRPDNVSHETPPVGGGMKRPEASLLASNSIRNAAEVYRIPITMVSAQRAKHRLTGNHNAEKSEVRTALQGIIENITSFKPMNENVYDAVAVGLVAMEEIIYGEA
jgi:Holliday junction resolvasome RuvABC endonuclease subunit